LADWRLAVHVGGDRFLNARTPFFRGKVSANIDLQGTLREPTPSEPSRSATALFGFVCEPARGSGLVLLTSDDPYARSCRCISARAFDYEIKMEVTGPAMVQSCNSPPYPS
jgi:hypothetical protein